MQQSNRSIAKHLQVYSAALKEKRHFGHVKSKINRENPYPEAREIIIKWSFPPGRWNAVYLLG